MEITYLNHSSFLIKTKHTGNALTKILIDPFSKEIGINFKQTEADMVLISHMHSDHNNITGVKGLEKTDINNDNFGELKKDDTPFIIKTPGEFEVRGVFVTGIHSFHDDKKGEERGINTIFVIENEDFRICHLGDLGHKLSESQIEQIGDVDVLMVPVGGIFTIDSETASEVVSQIEPDYVIPMHYKTDKHSELFKELSGVDLFIKEFGSGDEKPTDKFTVNKSTTDETELILLKPQYT